MAKKPTINTAERTGQQTDKNTTDTSLLKGVFGSAQPGAQPLPSTFATYRKMRENPTIALARMVATAPIRCSEWTVEADDGVPEEQVKFVQDNVTKIWHNLINDSLLALDYGYAPGEQIYDASEGQICIARVKPLLVDKTTILTDEHGNFNGLKNKANKTEVELEPSESFLYSYDCEAGNLYGRARHENIRATAWCEWMDLQKKRARYFKKSAGAVPMVHYPDGEATDAGGAKLPNYRLAKMLIDHLQDGNGICFPTMMKPWAAELARDGRAGEDMEAWRVDFLETKAQHGAEFTDAMRHCESLMLRGWLVPERAASEAQKAGSRADSETSADFAMLAVDLTLHDLVQCINDQIVNPLLVLNYGDKAKGTVRIKRAGVAPALQAFFRQLIQATLQQPSNVMLMLKAIDLNSLIAAAGLPQPKEVPTPEELESVVESSRPSPGVEPGGEPGPDDDEDPEPDAGAGELSRSMTEAVADVYRSMRSENYSLALLGDDRLMIHPKLGKVQTKNLVLKHDYDPKYVDQVAADIKKDGYVMPPILVLEFPSEDGAKDVVLDGHHRGTASIEAGLSEIPAWIIPIAEMQPLLLARFHGHFPRKMRKLDPFIMVEGVTYDKRRTRNSHSHGSGTSGSTSGGSSGVSTGGITTSGYGSDAPEIRDQAMSLLAAWECGE